MVAYAGGAATEFGTTTSPKSTGSITCVAGDLIVASVGGSTAAINPTISKSGAAITWELQESLITGGSACNKLWTATAPSSETFTVTFTSANTTYDMSGYAAVFRGHNGVGAAESRYDTSGIDIPITTTGDGSLVFMAIYDRNAIDGTNRSWLNGAAELFYNRTAAVCAMYVAYQNAGAAGAKNVGQAWHGAQNSGIVALEILNGAASVDKMGWGILL